MIATIWRRITRQPTIRCVLCQHTYTTATNYLNHPCAKGTP